MKGNPLLLYSHFSLEVGILYVWPTAWPVLLGFDFDPSLELWRFHHRWNHWSIPNHPPGRLHIVPLLAQQVLSYLTVQALRGCVNGENILHLDPSMGNEVCHLLDLYKVQTLHKIHLDKESLKRKVEGLGRPKSLYIIEHFAAVSPCKLILL